MLSPSSKIQFTGAPCSPPPSSAWFAGGCRPSQRFLQGGEVDKTLPSCPPCPRGCSDHDTHHSLGLLFPFSRVNSCFLSRAPPIPPPSLVHLSSLPAAEGRPEGRPCCSLLELLPSPGSSVTSRGAASAPGLTNTALRNGFSTLPGSGKKALLPLLEPGRAEHLVGFGEQSINISEGCFNKCLFAQKLLIPSWGVAMVNPRWFKQE